MKPTLRSAAALLSLLLVAPLAPAQVPAGDRGEPPSAAPETEGAGPATDHKGPEAESPAVAAPGRDASEPQRSPLDYRPSEQISEDLSVSFPVDI